MKGMFPVMQSHQGPETAVGRRRFNRVLTIFSQMEVTDVAE